MNSATSERLTLRVDELRREADGVLSLRLADPSGRPLPAWTPGEHVDVRFANGVERQYSLCSGPADGEAWRIAVLREHSSRGGSRYVHETLRPGDLVTVSHPLDTFGYEQGADYVFVAGGIGITALLPMVRAAEAGGAAWRLLYLGRSRERMAFLTDALLRDERTRVFDAAAGGRADLAGELRSLPSGVRVYACGPARMLDALEELALDWPPGTLRVERFAAKPLAEPLSNDVFEVEAARSGMTVEVEPGCSILAALERAGIPVPNSCLEGICGTCETAIVDGVADHRDSILSPAEREENETMMVCVSRAVSPRLVLDV
ncbi:MAG: PDR/VanB family oxidoreductase [Leifsonia sp.]|uniref:PDR/VanB family oxidoreductase n=1 Tax=Leifsonia sp. TaxID=1870902 RepID=UPI003F7E80D5